MKSLDQYNERTANQLRKQNKEHGFQRGDKNPNWKELSIMNKAGQSEALFIVKAFEKDWEIAQPFHYAQPYDFVIKKDGKWQTVQVKTAYLDQKRNKLEVRLQRNNGSYQTGDFDLLAIIYEKQVWLIDWECIKHISSKIMISGLRLKGYKYDKFII